MTLTLQHKMKCFTTFLSIRPAGIRKAIEDKARNHLDKETIDTLLKTASTWERMLAQDLADYELSEDKPYFVVPEDMPYALAEKLQEANEDLSQLYYWVGKLQGGRPSPYEFSKHTVWPDAQEYSDLLCLRPQEQLGLSLTTLHDAFRNFRRRMETLFECKDAQESIAAP
ncbi:hypothetical protein AX16_005067 [Volvariella volvacea WC 439]|nr:hypothetical protein AX16_005067 [Volvariella volvacea WC 439]